jgi:hypothetical protein
MQWQNMKTEKKEHSYEKGGGGKEANKEKGCWKIKIKEGRQKCIEV